MKKTISINIASTSFFIDEDAYAKLNSYLGKLEAWFKNKDGGSEIISDIESRLSELFSQRVNSKTGVITLQLVDEVISIMGEPEDFMQENDDRYEPTEPKTNQKDYSSAGKKLYRDAENKILGGVCAGIAAYFNLDSTLIRIIFVILPFISFGAIIPIYIVLWIALPEALTAAQRLQMRGEDININNIEKNIKEQFNEFKKSKTYKTGEEYLNRFNKRDRNILVAALVFVALIIALKVISFLFPFSHVIHLINPATIITFGFQAIWPLMIILLIIGIVIRPALKGILIAIVILFIISILVKMIAFVFTFPWMM